MANSKIDFLDLLLSCDCFEGYDLTKNGNKILEYNRSCFYAFVDNYGNKIERTYVGYSDYTFGIEGESGFLYQVLNPISKETVKVAYFDGNYFTVPNDVSLVYGYYNGYNIEDHRNGKEPIKKKETCFITTACTKSKSLPDDCAELTGLRKLRDNFLLKFPAGKKAVKKYYSVAPKIVEAIDKKENAKEVYDGLYQDLVLKSLELIEDGHMLQAFRNYQKVTSDLAKEYLPVRDPEMDKLFKPSLRRTRNSKGRKLVQKNENKDMSIAL